MPLLLVSCLCVAQPLASHAQLYTAGNYAAIPAGSSSAAIIQKAAHVVPSPRQLRWQQLELTGFLHFGMNTFTNKEWGDGTESPALFNPTSLDAGQWVRACKNGGIKQVIITAKHHDGFCLWPSKYTAHSVKSSPWKGGKGDVVKEVADACHAQKVGFGVYLSPWDRNSPYFGDSAKYNNYFVNQLTELLSNYGRVDEVWFDGANGEGPTGRKQVYDFNRWYALIRKLQPTAVIAVMGPDVRWVGTESGYGREMEWSVVPTETQRQANVAANSQKEVAFVPKNRMEDDLGSRAKIKHAPALVW
ncbi:MAG: alpha-L-fucosidase, partial [Hymenobacter sp.]